MEERYGNKLLLDFKKYSLRTGDLQIYPDEKKNLVIKFYKEDKGIKWLIRFGSWFDGSAVRGIVVNATINPKILGGKSDYISAANIDDMEAAIIEFNRISEEISPFLSSFEYYIFKRIDYCLNFSLNELVPGCSHELIMNLIHRADIPPHYVKWKEYDEKAHRRKSRLSSFYLKCRSANINCYSKYMKLKEQNEKNISRGFPPVSRRTMDLARDIIRFEIQCKYPKVYARSKSIGIRSILNQYHDLLGYRACMEQINRYYKVTIGAGDWYSLSAAKRIIMNQRFHKQKTDRLINVLQEVNQCRSLANAKAQHQGSDLAAFKRTVKDLADIGINPVTIPREWGINHIPNLLHTFNDMDLARVACPDLLLI